MTTKIIPPLFHGPVTTTLAIYGLSDSDPTKVQVASLNVPPGRYPSMQEVADQVLLAEEVFKEAGYHLMTKTEFYKAFGPKSSDGYIVNGPDWDSIHVPTDTTTQ